MQRLSNKVALPCVGQARLARSSLVSVTDLSFSIFSACVVYRQAFCLLSPSTAAAVLAPLRVWYHHLRCTICPGKCSAFLNSSFGSRLQLDVGPLLLCLTRRVAGCRLYEIQCKLICPGEQPLASLGCLRHSVGAPARTSGSQPPLPFITAITARIWLKGFPRWGPHAVISSEFEWPRDFWPETADSLQFDLPL